MALDDVSAAILYRSIRELLMNVVKHARSKTARISLRRAGDFCEATVGDDGVGFEPIPARAQFAEGFGLFSIREQVLQMGGDMKVDAKPGQGTRVKVRLPLRVPPEGA